MQYNSYRVNLIHLVVNTHLISVTHNLFLLMQAEINKRTPNTIPIETESITETSIIVLLGSGCSFQLQVGTQLSVPDLQKKFFEH